jgi:hypothetical protein
MFKNEMVQMLVDLQKIGTYLFLTDDGYREFIKLLHHERLPIVENVDQIRAV